MIPFQSGSNYFEIFISPCTKRNDSDIVQTYDVALTESEFVDLMRCVARANPDYKFFQKEYKEYVYGDIIVHNYKNTETRVFKYTPQCVTIDGKSLLMGFNRNKLTALNIPATKNIHDVNYVKKLIFRVTNRIFINFQTNLNQDGSKTYMVYINYNHDPQIDQEGIEKTMQEILSMFH
jgi:hypothetical protein